jgi:radical SAM protein with 4Fe4S-binding SPASM domain
MPEPSVDWDVASPPLPRDLQVEVTGACNLRCRMCLVSYRPGLNKRTGSLDLETFTALVDADPGLRKVTLQGLGEPLLNPKLFEMIEYAVGRGIEVGFNTNATLLTEARAEKLIRSGLSWLHLSVDGATEQTYEAIRRGSSFSRVVENIASLVAARARLGSATPRLSVVFVAMRRNLHELPGVVRLTAELGVERLWVQNLSHEFSDTDPAGAYRAIREFSSGEALWPDRDGGARAAFAEAEKLARSLGLRLRLPLAATADPEPEPRPAPEPAPEPAPGRPAGRRAEPGCDWPWRSAYVTHEGVVQPCCMVMGSDRAALGDLRTRSFAEIWSGPAYRDFRSALLSASPPEVCRGCALYRGTF